MVVGLEDRDLLEVVEEGGDQVGVGAGSEQESEGWRRARGLSGTGGLKSGVEHGDE